MQIIEVAILLPTHSYIVLGGKDATWHVLDGTVVALGRHTDERYLARSTRNIAFYVESTSTTTITKHLFPIEARFPLEVLLN